MLLNIPVNIRWFIGCFLLPLTPFFVNAQIDLPFLKHLSTNQLRREHQAYLEQSQARNDSIPWLKAKYYLQYQQDSAFLSAFHSCDTLFLSDTCAVQYAGIYFLKRPPFFQEAWFKAAKPPAGGLLYKKLHVIYTAAVNPLAVKEKAIDPEMKKNFMLYKRAMLKSPLLAASLSALIPGTGQLYLGRKKSFAATLITHLVYGFQSYESIKHLGAKHPLSLLNLVTFGVFYFSNIYGSWQDTWQIRMETKTQFLYYASDYYSASELNCTLYR